MVKVSTLFHRVDDFDDSNASSQIPDLLDQNYEDKLLQQVLGPLIFDPGDKLVQNILNHF